MSEPDQANGRLAVWTWVVGGLLLVAVIAGWYFLPLQAWAESFQTWIESMGVWGDLIFIGAYILSTILLIPVSVLTVVAGLVFGLGWGFFLVSIAATIGATIAYLIARYLVHDRVESYVQKHPKLRAANEAISEEGWKVVLLLRLSPVLPFNVQNYAYGITDVKLRHYVPATFFGILPGTLLYVYLGAAGQAAAGDGGSTLKWVFFAGGFIATVVVVVFVTRKAKRKLEQIGLQNETTEVHH
jgi:uncharacterized membrane protein YdjX (TVP38/TMEM64 family)